MTINGTISMSTYFVLNKKDRSGNILSRPYKHVLEEMKRQETEEAKLKQTTMLKGGNLLNFIPSIPKDSSIMHLFNSDNTKSQRIISDEGSSLTLNHNDEDVVLPYLRNSVPENIITNTQVKSTEGVSESRRSLKSLQRQSRSRTCQLL